VLPNYHYSLLNNPEERISHPPSSFPQALTGTFAVFSALNPRMDKRLCIHIIVNKFQ